MIKEKIILQVQVEGKMFQVNVLYLRSRNPEIIPKLVGRLHVLNFSFFLSSLSLKS